MLPAELSRGLLAGSSHPKTSRFGICASLIFDFSSSLQRQNTIVTLTILLLTTYLS